MTPDYYQLLAVSSSATQDEIKKSYKRLALKYHPDHNPGDAEAVERFKQVSQAYRVLGDEQRRRRYDRYGDSGEDGPLFQEVDVATVAEFFESIFGDLLGRRRRKGKDLRKEVSLSFEEAAFGVEKIVTVSRSVSCDDCAGSGAATGTELEKCPACSGRGEVKFQQGLFALTRPCRTCRGRGHVAQSPCPSCGGEGTKTLDEEVPVRFSAGTDTGARRVVKGFGSAGPDGVGDLHVFAKVKRHTLFEKKGHDVVCPVHLSFPQAALGDEVDVPTLDGAVSMKIRPGTQPGQFYKLRGKGIPRLGGTRGDQLVRIEVDVPRTLTPEQEELVKQLAQELGISVNPQQRGFLDKIRDVFT